MTRRSGNRLVEKLAPDSIRGTGDRTHTRAASVQFEAVPGACLRQPIGKSKRARVTMSDDEFGERDGERSILLPDTFDAGVFFIGRISTPWRTRQDCPKNSAESDAICTITLDPRYGDGLKDLETSSHVIVLYWMDRAPRNLVLQK